MARIRIIAGLLLLLSAGIVWGQKAKIVAGPMLGYVEKTEAMVWVQVSTDVNVEWVLNPEGRTDSVLIFGPVKALAKDSFAIKIRATGLKPGKAYSSNIRVAGKVSEGFTFKTQPLWEHRSDPPTFKLALGSCAYVNEPPFDRPGKPYGSNYKIFETIANQKPDLMLWTGDNTYLREVDWSSESGILHRYSHTRRLPEMQKLLKTCAHYAAWDDHDFGPNDADRSWYLKRQTKAAFEAFWPNPNFDVAETGGVTGAFSYADVQVFMMDDRYNRAPNAWPDSTKDYWGDKQLKWLLESLAASKASFKLVVNGGQVLNPAKVHENMANYPVERNKLLSEINRLKIKNVVFLTGDRHHTELTKLSLGQVTVLDLTCSPLTSGTHPPQQEGNYLQDPGTLVSDHNFGVLTFSGPTKTRVMNMSIYNAHGAVVWERELKRE